MDPEVLAGRAGLRHAVGAALPRQVPLADVGGAVAGAAERVRRRVATRGQEVAVPRHPGGGGVPRRHQRGPKRGADRVLADGGGAAHPLLGQAVEVGGDGVGVAAAAERLVAQLIGEDPQDVRP